MLPDLFDIVVRLALVIATSALFTLVLAAYLRLRNRRLLFICLGFGVFFLHALITVPELFMGFMISENMHLALHVTALALILFGTLKD